MFIILFCLCVPNFLVYCAENNVIIASSVGEIKGLLVETRLGKEILSFRGIPYAKPPIGKRRFKDPIPIDTWEGVFDATREGPACPQATGINLSEDCLTLNIYTKRPDGNKIIWNEKLPVIVFIHPGGFSRYSSQSFLYGPRYLLDQDVVLVTINHRLATLGFMNTGDERASGNYAFKDQVIALRFVRDHISSFGGDPDLVTISGHSSGARSIHLHLISHMSKGLFHRAILMSGSMTTPIRAQKEQIDVIRRQASLLNCTAESLDAVLHCLSEKPSEAFGKSEYSFQEWNTAPALIWYPSIEPEVPGRERFLEDDIEVLMSSKRVANVPLLISVTSDEFNYRIIRAEDEAREGNDNLFQDLNRRWDELAPICFQYERNTSRSRLISQEIRKFYFNNEPIHLNNFDRLQMLYANSIVHYPTYRALNLIAEHSEASIYFYEFTYKGRYSYYISKKTKKPIAGVPHADYLQYIFNVENPIYNTGARFPIIRDKDPEFLTMNRLTTMWAHFAKTGEPWQAGSQLFQNKTWQKYTQDARIYLEFGEDLMMKSDFLKESMDFWSKLFP
ncbi:hypothetical protein QAD02_022431 [Eretmocerus hayati]|uniref:Uncharacterized protein n=1 Tax=Eretmocerus hayati TaxID=131215 RepID=A0ACC2PWA1_9HYME|nr:hypothetical protein QAD02_022431 [Eretmocerus hayati]